MRKKLKQMLTATVAAAVFAMGNWTMPIHASDSGIITTVAGNEAELLNPYAVTVDKSGNVYIADTSNHYIRKLDPHGRLTIVAGTGERGYTGDGGPAASAQIQFPYGVAADDNGNVYFTDPVGHRIRKVDASGVITTFAGTGESGFSGDGGPAAAARLFSPIGIAVDEGGSVYFADHFNHRIRKIDPSGTISTVAGTGTAGFNGDRAAGTSARLNHPTSLEFDRQGNMYIADFGNYRIRKLDSSGMITTVAGTGGSGYGGDNGPASEALLNWPIDVAVDDEGGVLIADQMNNRIRRIGSSGIITTFAGSGLNGFAGDGGPAAEAQLNNPVSVAVDGLGNVYIADSFNNRIRKVAPPDRLAPVWPAGSSLSFSGVTHSKVTVHWPAAEDNVAVEKYELYMNENDVPVAIVDADQLSYEVSGLNEATAYLFTVKALDAAGNRSEPLGGGPVTTSDITAPIWPAGSGLTVTEITYSSAALQWSAAVDNVAVTGYRIYVNNGAEPIAQVGAGELEYTASGLVEATAYTFIVRATDAAGNISEPLSSDAVVTPDVSAPIWPSGSELSVTGITYNSASLQWPAAIDNVGVTNYRIYVNDEPEPRAVVGAEQRTYALTGLNEATQYTFAVTAVDAAGNESGKLLGAPVATPDISAPVWPEEAALTITDITRNSMKLRWPAATDNTAVTGYHIFMNGGSEPVAVMEGGVLEYTASGLRASTNYAFTVRPVDAAGNIGPALSASARTLASSSSSGSYSSPILSSSARLKNLELEADGKPVALNPVFDPVQTSYTGRTGSAQVTVKITAESSSDQVTVNGQSIEAGNTGLSYTLALKEGDNDISITVKSGFSAERTYKVSLFRESQIITEPPVEPHVPETRTVGFIDIAGHWAENDILSGAMQGWVNGYPDRTFKPNAAITREDFIVMLMRGLGLQENETAVQPSFADAAQVSGWAKNAVAAAAERGYIQSGGSVRFQPQSNITRAELVVIVMRALGTEIKAGGTTPFTDHALIPAWAVDSVADATDRGVVIGRAGTRFAPDAPATRAEAVSFILRMLERR